MEPVPTFGAPEHGSEHNTTPTLGHASFQCSDKWAQSYHAWTPLSVHASDLAVKEAFETEVKYWAAIADEVMA
jgi:hypothetical protein